MFPRAKLERSAREEGVVIRRRRVDPVKLLWVLLLTLDTRGERTIADLRRSYARVTGTRLAPSAFYGRLSVALARWIRRLAREALEAAAQPGRASRAVVGQIQEILCVDSTVVRLHDRLMQLFPACRTNHTQAAAKLHTVLNVRGCGPSSVKLTAERVHDGPVLRAGKWVVGKLLLFDLGYYRFSLFAAIGRQGGFFLTRLKEGANPTVVRLYRGQLGGAIPGEGIPLQDIKDRLRREVLDAEVEVRYRSRPYGGSRRGHTLRLRLVGLRDPERGVYHCYLTNLDPDTVAAEEIGKLYRARWAIELLFREMKSCYQLEAIPSAKPQVVEIFLYAAVLVVLLSRTLLHAVCRWGTLKIERAPIERWARLFVSAAPTLLTIMLDPLHMARHREPALIRFLAAEAVDPNVHRKLLLQRAGL
jgi:IS4 transposase